MRRTVVVSAQVILDLLVMSVAFWLAFGLRFELAPPHQMVKLAFFTWPYVVLLHYITMVLFGVPSMSWRFIGLKEAQRIALALGLGSGILLIFRLSLAHLEGHTRYVVLPLSIIAFEYVFSLFGVIGTRVVRRLQFEREARQRPVGKAAPAQRTVVIGAGLAGVTIAKEVNLRPEMGIELLGFVDDDPMKIGTRIQGFKVLGDTTSLPLLADELNLQLAIIAIASARSVDVRRIVRLCDSIPLPTKIVPGMYELLGGQVNVTRLRKVTIEDLLGRNVVELATGALQDLIGGKCVLVTGAGGSIGSVLCHQVAHFGPARLVLAEQAENALFEVHSSLLEQARVTEILPRIVDICDTERLDQIFQQNKPDVVFHAAAHKHVPMMEWNPGEAVKNNVFGTMNVAEAALRHGATKFVLISTDKAVNPTSIMGATKRAAELIIQGLSQRSSGTTFCAVRFGNVLGSAGSVVPIFRRQIENGGPVTVTHPEMTRYFMTIPEAAQLVMQAGAMGRGGEIFILDMGEPVLIHDLARDLIRLSGLSEEEIEIVFTGIRPGEKLHEELANCAEGVTPTPNRKISIGKIEAMPWSELERRLEGLRSVVEEGDYEAIRLQLSACIPEMRDPEHGLLGEQHPVAQVH